jgi:hypothetical protein
MDEFPGNPDLDELRKAIVQQKTASLPDGEQEPAFKSLHKIIFEYDQHVSQMVIGILTQSLPATAYPHRILLQAALEEAEKRVNLSQRRMLDQYRYYTYRLDHMHNLALRLLTGRY